MSTQFQIDFSGRLPVEAQIGMEQADAHADPQWKHFFDGIVLAVARRMPELTSDDVLAEYETLKIQPGTHNLSAIGPAMRRASLMGILRGTNRVIRSKRPEKNGNRHSVWESKVYLG